MSLELPPDCHRCRKPVLFGPFAVAVVDGAYTVFHTACAPKRLERLEPVT